MKLKSYRKRKDSLSSYFGRIQLLFSELLFMLMRYWFEAFQGVWKSQ